ncbi:MAG: hypothetical protein HY287_05655 [Planctomycetes bacterium]|nr:hypothetical protein [Planctomycetota bacterium]MBI3833797.1 hypothetical protein [Planctomycetota bacterium]
MHDPRERNHPYSKIPTYLLSAGLLVFTPLAIAQAPNKEEIARGASNSESNAGSNFFEAAPAVESPPALPQFYPLPQGTSFPSWTSSVASEAASERLIYSNTLGNVAAAFHADYLAADDITTIVPDGCALTRFTFQSTGRADPAQPGGPYSINYALYQFCPGSVTAANRPSLIIPGTSGTLNITDDGLRTNSIILPPNTVVPMSFYLGVTTNRANVGIIMGGLPTIGLSCDTFDYPSLACNSNLGGFPTQPHASFNAEFFTDATCPTAYAGYRNDNPKKSAFLGGANHTIYDDIHLNSDNCQMSAYEVMVKGSGFYSFDLATACGGPVIPGTHGEKPITATPGIPNKLRFAFDPPVPIPQDFWIGVTVNTTTSGVIMTGQNACTGSTQDLFCDLDPSGTPRIISPADNLVQAFDVTITCAGPAPTGACCDLIQRDENGEAVCRDVPLMNCAQYGPIYDYSGIIQPAPQWSAGANCESNPFPHPCGTSACCKPGDTCENLTQKQCNAVEPVDHPKIWQPARFCNENLQSCPFSACVDASFHFPSGDCNVVHDGVGCNDPFCCEFVCEKDSWCCQVEWDRDCVELFGQICDRFAAHDTCYWVNPISAAFPIDATSHTASSNVLATQEVSDPPNCCNDLDSGAAGYGTLWFSFTATHDSVAIGTCNTDAARDMLFGAYAATDSSDPQSACNSLVPLACADDDGCPGNEKSGKVCVTGLTPGQTYYIVVGSKTTDDQGLFQLDLQSPCYNAPTWNSNDCNSNGQPDGCDLASKHSWDCNKNGVPDECDIEAGTSLDCDANDVPDECDLRSEWLEKSIYPECTTVRGVAVHNGLIAAGVLSWTSAANATESVHLYRDNGISFQSIPSIRSPHAPNIIGLGKSIAITDQWIIVGAPDVSVGPYPGAGAIYVFPNSKDVLNFTSKLIAPEPGDSAGFGSSLSADGNRLIVGLREPDSKTNSIALIYEWEVDHWSTPQPLVVDADDSAESEWRPVSISGNIAAVGASIMPASAAADSGPVAFIFENRHGVWQRAATIARTDFQSARGSPSLDVFADRIIVGFPSPDYGVPGLVGIYKRRGDAWVSETWITTYVSPLVALEGAFAAVVLPAISEVDTYKFDGKQWSFLKRMTIAEDWNYASGFAMDSSWTVARITLGGGENCGSIFYAEGHQQADCNQNGISDACDIGSGVSLDCNANEIPDECEPSSFGDYDHDGVVDLRDFVHFDECMTGPTGLTPTPCCSVFNSVLDANHQITLRDFSEFGNEFHPAP